MDYIFQKPAGVKDFLPPLVRKKRQIERAIYDVFEKWGYEEIIAPSFEYLETFLSSNSPGFSEKIFKFFDRQGRVLALRSDVTTSIARMVATYYGEHRLPLRFCYISNVFRFQEPRKGRDQEFFQVGAELIGIKGIQADTEIILLASDILKQIGISDFIINIGHIKFLEGLLDEINADPGKKEQIAHAIWGKNFVLLEELIKDIPINPGIKQVLLSLSSFYGGQEILERLNKTPLNEKCYNALSELMELAGMLKGFNDIRLTFDPGLARGLDYYTGIVFEIYSPDSGFPLGGGGRYDNLMDKFNGNRPATGFALTEEALLSILEKDMDDSYEPNYIFYDRESFTQALKKAEELRRKNLAVKLVPMEDEENICPDESLTSQTFIIKTKK
ncbi:MAG: phosphoribosyltransferase regulatory subunit [Thermoanaerobacteraceae bacterium]|jgi:ATP phosphoribosyltransferase regulatory subunit|uniref:ATP phosphoribosyltransferase regulatory subunit n=1 Tax=Biomaibacter acetigenes TaxID=2316383 RepID=A0A3G2R664_9FIRM|nr:ATP phosphoribosyltransferase regulatory subunit [Biomaibacter acetigenes]AYO30886.1 ATP phosphoribosyltransferase regulatory subunit [Biomaibacter acetigenes]MDK2878724.1 phosphoribosyltransferase regulatory subunit [Thermoanaerobacteraceae bacterium]MDN5311797.1 phosphoribosyltransferase regulatory subunit [Thermoanaerobacteraceae bacterium]